MKSSNIIILVLLCLSFSTVTYTTHNTSVGNNNIVFDFSGIDNSENNDQVDDDKVLVKVRTGYFDQDASTHKIPNDTKSYTANTFERPLTRAPPKVII